MLDFNTGWRISLDNNQSDSFKKKIKSSIKKEISAKNARNASFITLASVLSACNFGGSSDSIAPLNISAIKGPLSNALAFVDRDGDGVHDDGEEFAVTSSTGAASITPTFLPKSCVIARESIAAEVDFPTPPFPLEIPIILLPLMKSFLVSSLDVPKFIA